jgi:hypothetical protein
MQVVFGQRSMDAVFRDDRVVIPVKRLTHRGLDGNVGLAAGDDEGADAVAAQQDLKLRVGERTGTMITNYLLALAWHNFESRRRVLLACGGCRPRMNDETSGAPRMAGQVSDARRRCARRHNGTARHQQQSRVLRIDLAAERSQLALRATLRLPVTRAVSELFARPR